ncbi:MAG: protein translocase subunit SecD [Alphaproteobacteria bacterium]|nr:protein translocase subunit SecD [Alphaproteobacteria bacterium]
MIYISRWKIFSILSVCLVGFLFALPNILPPTLFQKLPEVFQKTINLGLELRGGSHLQLEVDLKSVLKEQLLNTLDEVRATLRKEKIGYAGLAINLPQSSVVFSLRDVKGDPTQQDKVLKLLKKLDPQATIVITPDGQGSLTLSPESIQQRNKAVVEQSIEVVRRRIDETGTKEPLLQRQGNDRIIVQLPGVEDPAEVKRLIGRTAKMTFRMVDEEAGPIDISPSGQPRANVSPGSEILKLEDKSARASFIVIKKQVGISGDNLIDAQATFERDGGTPAVSLKFNAIGARKFADLSGNNIGRRFAIVLDDKVISAPVFRSLIPNGEGIISGNFTTQETHELSLLLRAGALPAPLNVIEERTVGPSMGADSIRDGQLATVLAFIFVAIFMIANYSLFGLYADIALGFNLIFLFAALSLLQATLTLPGIAGIALTIGMAVDANVLIYERIKEELRNGLRPVAAVEAGYTRAITTIVDSNLTTLIGAAVLFEFGTGPIRGFAVTLALGIVISLFTSLSLTRLIIVTWLRRRGTVTSLPI